MNILLQQLAAIVRDNPVQEKLLVVSSRSHGYQLMDELARQGTPWLNLRPVTPLGLAMEITESDLARRKLRPASRHQSLSMLDQVINTMDSRGELVYFKTIQAAGLLSRLLLRSFQDLFLAGVKPDQIDAAAFVNPQKGKELKAIFNQYDLALEANGLVDEALIYERAANLLPGDLGSFKSSRLLIPEQMSLSPSALSFLQRFQAVCTVLAQEPVIGIDNPFPRRLVPDDAPLPAESSLSYIFEPTSNPITSEVIEIFQAYGESCEVREVLRRIKKSGQPLDRVMLCVTRYQPYDSLICSEALRMGMPVTFAHGVPVLSTRPGQLLSGILEWIRSDYPVSIIYRLIMSGVLDVFPAPEAAALLRSSGVTWGKHNLLQRLEQMTVDLQAELAATIAAQAKTKAALLSNRLYALKQLKTAMEDITSPISAAEIDDRVDVARLCEGLAAIIGKYAPIPSEMDGLAQQSILAELAAIGHANLDVMQFGLALQRLETAVGRSTIGASGPRPGCLYVAGMEDGVWCSRPVTYLLGLDAARMEGRIFQDPVLLDCEREQISSSLELQRDQQRQGLYRVVSLLASRRGAVTISFPAYDVLEGRPNAPSSLLLQIYRLVSGQPQADYSEMLNSLPPAAVYIPDPPDTAIDERDWWLASALHSTLGRLRIEDVLNNFPALRQGMVAKANRSSDLYTEYDGMITGASLDPRLDADKVLSASAIETMAKCPFSYFLRYVLRIEPAEDMSIDNSAWLDAMQRGSLLHSIYNAYQQAVYGPGKPSQPDKKLLLEIAADEIEALRQQVPPPDLLIYRLEKEELLGSLEVYYYLLEEKHRHGGSLPIHSEVPFGMGADEVLAAGIGTADPVTIDLPGGSSFRLRGRIDLVEKDPDHDTYQIWDYKTGSTWGYSDRDFCKSGQQIQHLLYSIAAEQILSAQPGRGPVQIDLAGYLFPTDKGEGRTVTRRQSQRHRGLQAVEKVLELMGQGVFCSSSADTYCKFCDYALVCRFPAAVNMVNVKLANNANNCLEGWKELQGYE